MDFMNFGDIHENKIVNFPCITNCYICYAQWMHFSLTDYCTHSALIFHESAVWQIIIILFLQSRQNYFWKFLQLIYGLTYLSVPVWFKIIFLLYKVVFEVFSNSIEIRGSWTLHNYTILTCSVQSVIKATNFITTRN